MAAIAVLVAVQIVVVSPAMVAIASVMVVIATLVAHHNRGRCSSHGRYRVSHGRYLKIEVAIL